MASKKKVLEEKARLDSNSQGDAHDPLNVANIFEEHGGEENSEFKHTDYQKAFYTRWKRKFNLASKCCS